MRKHLPLFVVLAAFALAACSSKDKDDKKTPEKKPTPVKTTDKPVKKQPKVVKRPVNCLRVLGTQIVKDGAGTMKATLDGKPINGTYDAKATYEKNRIWVGVSTPPACGVVHKDKLKLVAFYKDAGLPVMRIQMTSTAGGVHKLDGKLRLITGMLAHGGEGWMMQFKKGTLTVTPKKLVPGKVTIDVKGGSGIALTKGKQAKFTLEGTFTGVVDVHHPPVPVKTPTKPGETPKPTPKPAK